MSPEQSEAQERRLQNAEAQVAYMTTEIASVLGLPTQSPADTVGSVRDLMSIAEGAKERIAAGRALVKAEILAAVLDDPGIRYEKGAALIHESVLRRALDRVCPDQETTSPSTTSS